MHLYPSWGTVEAFAMQGLFSIKRVMIAARLSAILTCLLINAQLFGIALRHCSTTRWDMCKISVPPDTALALWARSNHERLFLRGL
jgi:hypothetical protein